VKNICWVTFIFASLFFILGCSQTKNPISQPDIGHNMIFSGVPDVENSSNGHELLGLWTLKFDPVNLSLASTPERELSAHFNVRSFLPFPTFQVISYDPMTGLLEVDVTIHNNSVYLGYDLRLIVFTDNYGIRLRNYDNWTSLYDISGGTTINPFKAFAKYQSRRKFGPNEYHTERLQLYFPSGGVNLNYAIDVSYPDNCQEPYMICNFTQEQLYPLIHEKANVSMEVYDNQYDVSTVTMTCPPVLGGTTVEFTPNGLYEWDGTVENITGAKSGNYTAVIAAKSGTASVNTLYQVVTIEVKNLEPRVVGQLTFPTGSWSIKVRNKYAYILNVTTGLNIVYINNPLNPVLLGSLPAHYQDLDLAISGNYAYIAEAYDGLRIVDITDPNNPGKEVDYNVPTEGKAVGVTVANNTAYVCSSDTGLSIVDVRNPTEATIKSVYRDVTQPTDVEIYDRFAYVADLYDFIILDINDPTNPQLVSKYITNTDLLNVYVYKGQYAYLLDRTNDVVHIFNIQNPVNPYIINNIATEGWVRNIVIQDDFAFVLCYKLLIQDVKDPYNIQPLYSISAGGEMNDAAVQGNYVYVADFWTGLNIVQVWDQ
jgi:hypothetical protein